MMCADARYIPHLCLNSLGGLLRAQTLTVHRERHRQRARERVISLLTFKSMNFHLIFVSFVVTVRFAGAAGGGVLKNGSLIHR